MQTRISAFYSHHSEKVLEADHTNSNDSGLGHSLCHSEVETHVHVLDKDMQTINEN